MANLFVANPDVLQTEGNAIVEQGDQFNQNVEKMYSTVDDMLSKSYLSPAARSIGDQIKACKDDLDLMTKIIKEYGNYCLETSVTVIRNEENIIDNINAGGIN